MTGSTFTVHRTEDVSGVSGTGVVAEGWESSDGQTVVVKWLSTTPSLEIWPDIRHVEKIHGHGGKTQIVWDSPTQYTPTAQPRQTGCENPNWREDYPDNNAHDERD